MRSRLLHPDWSRPNVVQGWEPGCVCGLGFCTRTDARVRSGPAAVPGWWALVSGSVPPGLWPVK